MILLGIDLETGGEFNSSNEENFITEIGAVLWDTKYNAPVAMQNILIRSDKEISKEAEQYTGISTNMVNDYGITIQEASRVILLMFNKCDFVVAHNGLNFDKPIMEKYFNLPEKFWIDTMIDVGYPANCVSKNLTYLAGFHLILNSFPHRAITDVLTMLTILAKYDLNNVIESAKSPMVKLQAIVSFDNKELAKKAGFKWDGSNKIWIKEMRQAKANKFCENLPFSTRAIA